VKIEFKSSEVLILLAAAVMSFIANLPDEMLGNMVDRKVLLAGLIALVVVALFRYLQVYLLLTISILAVGANLPEQTASALGISQTVLIIALGALIAIALVNRAYGFLPLGLEKPSPEVEDFRQDIMEAIARGDQAALLRLLVMNAGVNFIYEGTTPLHLAAEKGYPEIVRLLISYGADYRKKNEEGMTALDIALSKKKFIQTTEILHKAGNSNNTTQWHSETRRVDAELWQRQNNR
jgi:hypothetical protein